MKENLSVTIDLLPREIRKDVKLFLNKDIIISRILYHHRVSDKYLMHYHKLRDNSAPKSMLVIIKGIFDYNQGEIKNLLSILEDGQEKEMLCEKLQIDNVSCIL